MLQSAKLEGRSHLSPLTSDWKLQGLKFALLVLSLALVKCFLMMACFLPL